jgi:amino acid transporter
LAQGSELGFIGGFVSVLVIAVANTLFAFVTAFGIRYVFHVNKVYKYSSIVAIIGIVCVVISFILLVGHYRDSLQSDPIQASHLAILSFQESLFGIEDFNAWVLIAISALAYIVLVIKFLFADDMYPGYVKLTHEVKAEEDNWADISKQVATSANSTIETFQRDLSSDHKIMRTDYNKYKSSLERSRKILGSQSD